MTDINNHIKGCCAHLNVKWKTRMDKDYLTHGWWQCNDCRTRFALLSVKQYESNMKLINDMYAALSDIKAICGEDIALHFSDKVAKKINKAIEDAEKNI